MAFYPGTRMNPASSCSDISQVVESLHIKVALQNAFHPYFFNITLSIDDVYVEGVSLTYGHLPRQHIWTFVNETQSDSSVCPCTRPNLPYTGVVPPFIGQDYFCETGS